jgi:molybdopterin-guanine dinucleotide biosynthesis protein A
MILESYILVGGRSSRFAGGDKPSARIGGKTLAENAVDIVRTALPESKIFFVARNADQFVDESRRLGVGLIHDSIEGRGPLGGLFAALANCQAEWLFLFACDMPLMSSRFIAEMRRRCDARYGVVLPRQLDGRLQPLCAYYNVLEAIPAVEALVHRPGGTPAMMEAIDALEAWIVEPEEAEIRPEAWANVNTAETLAEIERKLSGGSEI